MGGFGFGTVGIYLYEDAHYRRWITELALAFYEGRQDEFIWMDLVKQFRNPEKQQLLPLNFTKEIIDEISILYREAPIYKIIDSETGKSLKKDQAIWNKIQKSSRYLQIMDKVDRWCHLLGTVLVKVSFVDKSGKMVQTTEEGFVQLDVLHGGVYDVKYANSPYFISELLIGFGQGFVGFGSGVGNLGRAKSQNQSDPSNPALNKVTEILWTPTEHTVTTKSGDTVSIDHDGQNPYGTIPAVPFFNQEPAHYYFLPINEPLIYANHALNMRMTDLNHIAKFQSFGVPVLTGVERGTSIRRGRPVDDFNMFRAGSATRGQPGMVGRGAGMNYRNFDNSLGSFSDGNADANAVGMSIGPDTAIAVGEKGDFKFASPDADIKGLAGVIQQIQDWVRINHGLTAKGSSETGGTDGSGFAKMVSKIGVLEENIRRQKLFLEREQQLFDTIKTLWNTHYSEDGSQQFSENASLEVTYVEPQFPVDPLTKVNVIEGQRKIIQTGDKRAIKELFKHLSEEQIDELIAKFQKDRLAQTQRELDIQIMQAETLEESGIQVDPKSPQNSSIVTAKGADKSVSKMDNRAKHSEDSSKQKGKTLDTRKQPKEERAAKPQGKEKEDK